jgi:hypothetical protein
MIWFFRRGNLQVDIEVRRIGDPDAFELVIDYPDGSEGVQRFTNPRKLVRRALRLQQQLIRDGWVPSGPGMRFRLDAEVASRTPAKRRRAVPRLLAYVHRQVAARLAATFGL